MTYKPSFHSTDSFGDKSLLVNLENNMKSFLTWGFLNIGGYVDVKIPTSNINSFNQHILRPSKDKTAANYTVWQSPKKDWVYESGVDYQGSSPIAFSGLYIDSSFYPAPTGSGSVSYTVDQMVRSSLDPRFQYLQLFLLNIVIKKFKFVNIMIFHPGKRYRWGLV